MKRKKRKKHLGEFTRESIYVLILWSLAALISTGQIPVAPLVLYAGLVLYSYKENSLIRRLPSIFWTILTLLAFLGGLFFSQFDFLLALLLLFFYLILNKISNPMQKRDQIQVIGLCLFLCISSAVVTDSLLFSLFLVGFIFLFTITTMLVTFEGDIEEAYRTEGFGGRVIYGGEKPPSLKVRVATSRMIRYNFSLLFFIIPLAMLLFLFIPRFSTEHLFLRNMRDIRQDEANLGYSESVSLGSMVNIKKDRKVALRVQPQTHHGSPYRLSHIYMRGASLDFYDGRRWFKSGQAKRMLEFATTNQVTMNAKPNLKGMLLRQKVFLEPPAHPYIFGAYYPHKYIFKKPLSFMIDSEGNSLRLLRAVKEKITYVVYSLKETPHSRQQTASAAKQEPGFNLDTLRHYKRISKLYLQLPRGGLEKRVVDLANQIAREAETPYEKASRIERHLTGNYRYSLDFTEKGGVDDPLSEFLFDRKTGHCEYFATAMAILCRSIQLPARIVSGYYTTEWNDYGEYFIVRGQDAHSWVEVWFPSLGWLSFDPTPPEGRTRSRGFLFIPTGIRKIYDTLKFKWYQYIIDYNLRDQAQISRKLSGLTGGVGGKLQQAAYQVRDLIQRTHTPRLPGGLKNILVWVGLLLIFFTGIGLILNKLGKSRWRHKPGAPSYTYKQTLITQEYQKILARLFELGFARSPSDTPGEFATTIAGKHDWLGELLPLTRRYYAIRFRHDAITDRDREAFRHFTEKIKDYSRSR